MADATLAFMASQGQRSSVALWLSKALNDEEAAIAHASASPQREGHKYPPPDLSPKEGNTQRPLTLPLTHSRALGDLCPTNHYGKSSKSRSETIDSPDRQKHDLGEKTRYLSKKGAKTNGK